MIQQIRRAASKPSFFCAMSHEEGDTMSERKIINAVSTNKVPKWGNQKKYIAIHYLGVVGQNHDLSPDGSGAHFYIYWDGTIYQRCSLDAVVWACLLYTSRCV